MFRCSPLGCIIVHRSCLVCCNRLYDRVCRSMWWWWWTPPPRGVFRHFDPSIHPATTLPRSMHSSAVAALLLVASLPPMLLERLFGGQVDRSLILSDRYCVIRWRLSTSHPNISSTHHLQGDNANHFYSKVGYIKSTYLVWIILYSPDTSE